MILYAVCAFGDKNVGPTPPGEWQVPHAALTNSGWTVFVKKSSPADACPPAGGVEFASDPVPPVVVPAPADVEDPPLVVAAPLVPGAAPAAFVVVFADAPGSSPRGWGSYSRPPLSAELHPASAPRVAMIARVK